MNTIQICNPSAEKPFPSFEQNTTTYVCLPDNTDCQLYVQVEQPGELIVESDGEELRSFPIDPSKHIVPLSSVLNPVVPARGRSLFTKLTSGGGRSRKIRNFSVIVKRNDEPQPVVAAIFHFVLLNLDQYQHAYTRHLEQCEECNPRPSLPERLIVDWEAPDTKRCWHCQEMIESTATECAHCGSEQDQGEPQS